MKNLNRFGLLSVVILGIAAMLGSQSSSTRSDPEPEFTSFSLAPAAVCLNQGLPLIQVDYTFDPDGWSNETTLCTTIEANGQTVHDEWRHQCLDDGTSGTYTFSVFEQFGTNVPPEITVSVQLLPLVDDDAYDIVSGTVTTIPDCPPPGGIPNP